MHRNTHCPAVSLFSFFTYIQIFEIFFLVIGLAHTITMIKLAYATDKDTIVTLQLITT